MVHRQHRKLVGADLVRHIAVGSDAIRPDDHPGNTARLHQMGGRRVDVQRGRHAIAQQLPGGQARTLQPGAGFVHVDALHQPVEMRRADDTERGAETAGRQGTGVAVSKQVLRIALMATNEVDTELRHGQIGLPIALMYRDGLGLQRRARILAWLEAFETFAHLIQRPEQIDRRGTRCGKERDIFLQRLPPITTGRHACTGSQDQRIGRTDADGRRAAHDHVANGVGDRSGRIAAVPDLFGRQLALIEQAQAIAMPLDRFHLFRGQQALAHGISLVQLRRSRTHDAPRTAKKKPGSRPNRAFYLDMAGNSEASHPGREC